MGGFFGESKSEILLQIPERFKPKTLTVNPGNTIDTGRFRFPVILKPDIGERGQGVKRIETPQELEVALGLLKEAHILQEFIDYPIELGIMYYRFPDGSESGITSVTLKGMMSVTGDGISTVEELMKKKTRSRLQIGRFLESNSALLKMVPEKEKKIILEHRGNHCLGTEFINANHLIHPKIIALFDEITANFGGFHYGRFDVKVKSIEDLMNGEVMIFELNGVSSEPGHIYDIRYNLFKAYRDVAENWQIMGKISEMNLKKGVKTASLKLFLNTVINHFKS